MHQIHFRPGISLEEKYPLSPTIHSIMPQFLPPLENFLRAPTSMDVVIGNNSALDQAWRLRVDVEGS